MQDIQLASGIRFVLQRMAELGDSSTLDKSWEPKLIALRRLAEQLCQEVTLAYFLRALEVVCRAGSQEWRPLMNFLTAEGHRPAPSQDPRVLALWSHWDQMSANTGAHDQVAREYTTLIIDLSRTHQIWLQENDGNIGHCARLVLNVAAVRIFTPAQGTKIVPFPGHPDYFLVMDDTPPGVRG